MSPKVKHRVLVVDDHPVVRQGIIQLINGQADLEVCCEAETGKDALSEIAAHKPDVAVVDLSLRDTSGIELVKDIKIRYPKFPVLVLSMHDESIYAERALRAGARGYIMKEEATGNVLTAIRQVLDGKVYLSNRMTSRLLTSLASGRPPADSPVSHLSDRELEVLQLIGGGQGTAQIARKLHLSVKTVESYRAHLKEKLNLNGATELQYFAIQWAQKNVKA
jgi:DNA-binding NarL/FixJ family response regulator